MISQWNLCYDDMNLFITTQDFIIEPSGKEELLIIDRCTGEAKVQNNFREINNHLSTQRVCGILGTISLVRCNYLLVATHRLYVGMIGGVVIWRLAGYDIIPYSSKPTRVTEVVKQDEMFLKMLRKVLDTPYLYFSYAYNLTHSQQQIHFSATDSQKKTSLIECCDSSFVWNGALLRNFKCNDMNRFQLPLILGFVSINQIQISGQTMFWSIISRRSVHMAGTRFFTRGIDSEGHVANFVETEQILEYNGQRISFVQIRGSMPFYWSQLPNLRYKPQPKVKSDKVHLIACTRHFNEQISKYGRLVLVNLVDQKRAEGALENIYRTLVQLLGNRKLRYEAFDFHAECKKMRWDRLNILIDRLAMEQDDFSVFQKTDDGVLKSTQSGVFRTNCIDCLDRTNVVQSMLAKRSLTNILKKLMVLKDNENIEMVAPAFESLFKSVWADNADVISLQYSGTGALKTDFTRTGKRTIVGQFRDGANSLTRYYLNNFSDGFRQDSIDLFLGRYVVTPTVPLPSETRKSWPCVVFPSMLLFSVAMLYVTTSMQEKFGTESLLYMLFWSSLIGVSITGIFHYCYDFVDWPRFFRSYIPKTN